MKLIVTWSSSDGCTYSAEHTECIEYKSEEDFIEDLEKWCQENKDEQFLYCGSGFINSDIFPDAFFERNDCGNFEIRTLEQWFEDNVNKG